jgi:hypothetical protein
MVVKQLKMIENPFQSDDQAALVKARKKCQSTSMISNCCGVGIFTSWASMQSRLLIEMHEIISGQNSGPAAELLRSRFD